jgi:hypothetical protein
MGGTCSAYGEERGVYRVLVRKHVEKRPLGDPGVVVRIILGWIFMERDVGVWTGLGWLMIDTVSGQL